MAEAGTLEAALAAYHGGKDQAQADWIVIAEASEEAAKAKAKAGAKTRPPLPLKRLNLGIAFDLEDTSVQLPPDVTGLEQWGHTVCKLAKVAPLDATYVDLLYNGSEKVAEYLKWIYDHGSHSRYNTGVQDLSKYLRRAGVKFIKQPDIHGTMAHETFLANRELRQPLSRSPGPYRYNSTALPGVSDSGLMRDLSR
jgi:hypothetical protein